MASSWTDKPERRGEGGVQGFEGSGADFHGGGSNEVACWGVSNGGGEESCDLGGPWSNGTTFEEDEGF
ncbi:hypothetical protein Fmac_005685 [Flemingia macrophylla]|uniref:Uncharacterized protein n=1 Tax=Flemingia macrophylla TaxID=520843 RepID=A0ABD1N8G1_9FABA